MTPQEPETPPTPTNPTAPDDPTPPPTPSETPPTPEPSPEHSSPAATEPPATPDHSTKGGGSKKLMLLILGGAVVMALTAGGVFFGLRMLGGIKLGTYTNENFSLLVPVDYKVVEEDAGVTFEEKDQPEDDKSEVAAFYSEFPTAVTDEQQDAILDEFKNQLETYSQSLVGAGDEVKDVDISDTTFKGHKAVRMTGDAVKDGKQLGRLTLVAFITDKGIYMVGVGADESDPSLGKKVDEIINSFEPKS